MPVQTDFGRFNTLSLPPDSTGKQMALVRIIVISYTNLVGTLNEGDSISGNTSNFNGRILTHVDLGGATGQFSALADRGVIGAVTTVTVGETVTAGNGATATVEDVSPIYLGGNVISSGDNPFNTARVFPTGGLQVRFQEGDQQLSAFGATKMQQDSQLAFYTHIYDSEEDQWYDNVSGVGSLFSYIAEESAVAADVGTVSGGIAERTTHRYHMYQPGYGQYIQMTIAVGDSGKTNVRRRWGYFDDDNGVYFELDGTNLYVVIRSSTSGSMVDTRIARADWNGDQVDGSNDVVSNLSGVNLNVGLLNLYWIDFQWLGAGRIRFGIVNPSGERITIHSVENSNLLTTPWCTTPILPIRWGVENTDVSASPSRIKMVCSQVSVEGVLVPDLARRSIKWETEPTEVVGLSETYIKSVRAKTMIGATNPIINRKTTILEKLTVYVRDQPCRIRLYANGTIDNPTWEDVRADSAAECDESASAFSNGTFLLSWVLDPGCHDVDFPDNFGLLGKALRLGADGTQNFTFTLTVESLTPGTGGETTVQVSVVGIDI